MAAIYLSNPDFFKAGEGGQSAVVGLDHKVPRTVRYTLTAPDVGASHIKIRITNWYDADGTYPDRLRCAITTDPTSHADVGPDSPYDFRPYRDGVAWAGEADCILVPGATYYLWIYPDDFSTYGYMWWGVNDRDAVLETSGAAASVLSCDGGTLGSAVTLRLRRYSSSATHTISATCGKASTQIVSGLAADSYSWTPPIDWASQNTSGTSVYTEIRCDTIISGRTVGTSYARVYLNIPESIVPTVTMSLSDPSGLLGELGSYIQSKSRVRIQSKCQGAYGSWLKAWKITCGSQQSDRDDVTFDLPAAGAIKITAQAIDSRGRTGTASQTIQVAPYQAPRAEILKIYRCDTDGTGNDQGDHATVVFDASVTDLVAASARYTLKYRERGSDAYWTSQELSDLAGTAQIRGGTAIFSADPSKAYECSIEASDRWGAKMSPYRTCPTAFALIQIDGERNAMGIMQQAGPDGCIAVGAPLILNRGMVPGNIIAIRDLRPGDDLNLITEPGVYSVPSNEIATQIAGIPHPAAGRITVINSTAQDKLAGTWVYELQCYEPYTTGIPSSIRPMHTEADPHTWIWGGWEDQTGGSGSGGGPGPVGPVGPVGPIGPPGPPGKDADELLSIRRFVPDPQDDPVENSRLLQALIDAASEAGGGSIYIPAGRYRLGSTATIHFSTGRISDCCVRMRSNVSIYGDGAATVLLPVGETEGGLDAFYFNDYSELGEANYLENCRFEDFVIDSAGASCRKYSTAGKGFMFDLLRNCIWRNVTVLHTDGTGLGVDCPINCLIDSCTAVGCGKAAPSNGHGASGIGIGFGYSNQESMVIRNCKADNNANYGIFYEHQRRFKPELYQAITNQGLQISGCTCSENYHNYGSERGINVHISGCLSAKAKGHGYLVQNAELCTLSDCASNSEAGGSFVIKTTKNDPYEHTTACKDIVISGCTSKNSDAGIKLYRDPQSTVSMDRIAVMGNAVLAPKSYAIDTYGTINDLMVSGNMASKNTVSLNATGTGHISRGNSWDK